MPDDRTACPMWGARGGCPEWEDCTWAAARRKAGVERDRPSAVGPPLVLGCRRRPAVRAVGPAAAAGHIPCLAICKCNTSTMNPTTLPNSGMRHARHVTCADGGDARLELDLQPARSTRRVSKRVGGVWDGGAAAWNYSAGAQNSNAVAQSSSASVWPELRVAGAGAGEARPLEELALLLPALHRPHGQPPGREGEGHPRPEDSGSSSESPSRDHWNTMVPYRIPVNPCEWPPAGDFKPPPRLVCAVAALVVELSGQEAFGRDPAASPGPVGECAQSSRPGRRRAGGAVREGAARAPRAVEPRQRQRRRRAARAKHLRWSSELLRWSSKHLRWSSKHLRWSSELLRWSSAHLRCISKPSRLHPILLPHASILCGCFARAEGRVRGEHLTRASFPGLLIAAALRAPPRPPPSAHVTCLAWRIPLFGKVVGFIVEVLHLHIARHGIWPAAAAGPTARTAGRRRQPSTKGGPTADGLSLSTPAFLRAAAHVQSSHSGQPPRAPHIGHAVRSSGMPCGHGMADFACA
eukprot:gene11359-biopygen11102